MAEAAVARKAQQLLISWRSVRSGGSGHGNQWGEDMQIPFLRIPQPLSPQLIKNDPKFIKGASAGDIFNMLRVGSGRLKKVLTCCLVRIYQASGISVA